MKTQAVQRYADNGEYSHTEIIDTETGEVLSCGNCAMFECEDTQGDGYCAFHCSFTNCESWCEDHILK